MKGLPTLVVFQSRSSRTEIVEDYGSQLFASASSSGLFSPGEQLLDIPHEGW